MKFYIFRILFDIRGGLIHSCDSRIGLAAARTAYLASGDLTIFLF